MDRKELEAYLAEVYAVSGEKLFARYPTFSVYRHGEGGKWFCVLMRISKEKLGLPEKEFVEAANLKCDAELAEQIRDNVGIFPAYHMNKRHWITVIPEALSDTTLFQLIAQSYRLTSPKKKKGTEVPF